MTALPRAGAGILRSVADTHSLWTNHGGSLVESQLWVELSVRAALADRLLDAPLASPVLLADKTSGAVWAPAVLPVVWVVVALLAVGAVLFVLALAGFGRRSTAWPGTLGWSGTLGSWGALPRRGSQRRRVTEVFGRVDSFTVTADTSEGPFEVNPAARKGSGGAASLKRRARTACAALRTSPSRRWFLVLAVGVLTGSALGGLSGVLIGACASCLVWRWLDAQSRVEELRSARERRVAAGQLPLTAELLAACMAAGSAPADAARAVGTCLGGPLGERLVRVCEELRLGAEPATAWSPLAELPGGGPLARCLVRAQLSGAPAVEQIARQAADTRAAGSRRAMTGARKAAVLVTGPLGLCFLPAFLLAGVAPVVVGLGRTLL